MPPKSGATMNSHTWLRAVPPTNRAGPRLRAGLTDVPSIGMPLTRRRHIGGGQQRRCSILAAVARQKPEHGGNLLLAQTRLSRHDAAVGGSAYLQFAHEPGGDHHHQIITPLGRLREGNDLFVQRRKAAGYAGRLRAVANGTAAGEYGGPGNRFIRHGGQRGRR